MALYVFNKTDGQLVSWCQNDDDPVASDKDLQDKGLTKVTGLPPLDAIHVWDAARKTVVDIASPSPDREFGVPKWKLRFTAAEMDAIRGSQNPEVRHLLYALDSAYSINLNDPDVVNGVVLLVSLGLLDQSRVDAILA